MHTISHDRSQYLRPLIAALLLALCVFCEFRVYGKVYFLYCACFLWTAFFAVRYWRSFFRPDLLCGIFAVILTLSVHINTNFTAFLGSPLSTYADRLWPLSFFPWYFFLRSFRFPDWRFLCASGERGRPRLSILQAAALALLFGFILYMAYLPYYPYGISQDVIDQYAQITGELSYNRVHAIGHTIFLKALLSICDNFVIVVLFQLISVVVLYIFYAGYFYSRGLPLYLIAFFQALALTFISDSTEAFFVPWKDTPAALCLGAAALIFMMYADTGKLSRLSSAILGAALAWCFLFRLNGIIALAVCGGWICVSLLRKKLYPQLALVIAAAALSILSVELYADNVLHASNPDNGFSVQVFGSGIAAVVNNDDLTDDELAEIDAVLPVDWMRGRDTSSLIWNYDYSPRITSDPNMRIFNNEYVLRMGENKKAVISLYFKLLPAHLTTCVRDILGNTEFAWKLLDSFFIPSYVFQFMVIFIIARSNRLRGRELMPFAPTLCNTVSILISTTTNETRYLLPTFMLAPCLILYSVLRGQSRCQGPEEPGIGPPSRV